LVENLCALFIKEYGDGPHFSGFHFAASGGFTVEEQVLLDEVVDWIMAYEPPPPGVHDFPPLEPEMLRRIGLAKRAREWENRLLEKTKSSGRQRPQTKAVGPEPSRGTEEAQNGIEESKKAEARFVFRRAGSHWDVVFEGGDVFHLDDTLGAKYLDYLLHHPNAVISALDLELVITPEKANARTGSSRQQRLDAQAAREMLRELTALRAKHEELVAANRAVEAAGAQSDVEEIEKELSGGKNLVDDRERARGNVSKAIAAVRRKLRRGDVKEKAFGEYLDRFVSTGHECQYICPGQERWA
jgi:hypothetical protein